MTTMSTKSIVITKSIVTTKSIIMNSVDKLTDRIDIIDLGFKEKGSLGSHQSSGSDSVTSDSVTQHLDIDPGPGTAEVTRSVVTVDTPAIVVIVGTVIVGTEVKTEVIPMTTTSRMMMMTSSMTKPCPSE